jgi:pilus assembly protein CpaB
MNKSVLMIMGGALIVAVIVALVVQAKLSPKTNGAPAPALTEVLVTTKKLAIGDLLKPEDLRWQSWPQAAVYQGVIRKTEQADIAKLDIYTAPLRRGVEAGEPLTRQALVPNNTGGNNFLAALIAPGMRAVGISVKAETMAGGFIAPGDFVDVILSYTPGLSGALSDYSKTIVQRMASQTILKNVRVLAVDQDAKDGARAAKAAKTVTLEVTQEGAQLIALAARMGTMSLALRRLGEKDEPRSVPVITSDILMSDIARMAGEAAAGARKNTVRMYSGTTVTNIPVRPDSPPEGQGAQGTGE